MIELAYTALAVMGAVVLSHVGALAIIVGPVLLWLLIKHLFS